MPDSPLRLLLIDDDAAYAALVAAELETSSPPISLEHVTTLRTAEAALAGAPFDGILLDPGLPDSQGIATVDRVHALAADVPIVVVTGHDSPGAAVQAVQRGAQDYLVKGTTDVQALTRAIRHARERAGLRQELRESEARFRALVEYSLDAITLIDENFVALYNSRSVERVSGYRPEELMGQRLDLLGHPDDIPELRRCFEACLAQPGLAVPLAYRYQHKDGTWHWGEGVAVNRLADPAVRAIVVNHRDVTERKVAEQALRASEEQLLQATKMEAIGRLAGGVAHDFNNVLTAIFGYSDLLLDQFGLDDPRRADMEEIRRSAERAAALTRQLLAFSRKQVMQPRLLVLNEVIGSVEKLLTRLVGEDITVEIRAARDLWTTRADPGQLEQVLMNLAANGRDAMPEGGRLTIETANVELTEEQVADYAGLGPGAYVALSLTDTGQGIPEAVRKHIFEPFFTTKQVGKGTGLGLAMVYGIVKQTGGGIYVTSEEGKGTRFVVYLPRVPSE